METKRYKVDFDNGNGVHYFEDLDYRELRPLLSARSQEQRQARTGEAEEEDTAEAVEDQALDPFEGSDDDDDALDQMEVRLQSRRAVQRETEFDQYELQLVRAGAKRAAPLARGVGVSLPLERALGEGPCSPLLCCGVWGAPFQACLWQKRSAV